VVDFDCWGAEQGAFAPRIGDLARRDPFSEALFSDVDKGYWNFRKFPILRRSVGLQVSDEGPHHSQWTCGRCHVFCESTILTAFAAVHGFCDFDHPLHDMTRDPLSEPCHNHMCAESQHSVLGRITLGL